MRKVLFLAYLFPPIVNSGTRRSLAFANNLPDCGWKPLVLSWEPDHTVSCDAEMLAELRPGTQVERVPLLSRVRAQRWAAWVPPKLRERVVEGISWRLRTRDTLPDEAAGWLRPVVERALQVHQREGFDVIYASGWPWTAFVAAREISRITGKPYVLDYRDQWAPSGDMAWEQATPEQLSQNPLLERQAAKDAAAVITVTRTLVHSVGRDCGRDDLHLITNGFEPADFEAAIDPPGDGLLRIAYTGVWRPGYGLHDLYTAIDLLKSRGCHELARLRVHAAGFQPGPAAAAGLTNWVSELGPVPHGQAVALMKQADLLYLPVPAGYYATASLPGKLFEYLACGRTILAVVPVASEVAQVLAETGGGIRIDPGDVESLAQMLLEWPLSGLSLIHI